MPTFNKITVSNKFSKKLENSIPKLFHIQDQKPGGTNGGTFTAGDWRIRDLNTVVTNEITGASLDAGNNQFTLPAGKYRIRWRAPGHSVNRHMSRLYNVTDSAEFLVGYVSFTNQAPTESNGDYTFTIASTKTFRLEHRCETSESTNGFGVGNSTAGWTTADINIFSEVWVWKIGDV